MRLDSSTGGELEVEVMVSPTLISSWMARSFARCFGAGCVEIPTLEALSSGRMVLTSLLREDVGGLGSKEPGSANLARSAGAGHPNV